MKRYGFKQLTWLVIIGLFSAGCATTMPSRPEALPYGGIYHIVGSGQNLYRISKAYGVSINEIMRANNIKDANRIGVGERLFIPHAGRYIYVKPYTPEKSEPIGNLVGPKHYKVKWRTITLHHSATKEGNAETFDRNHRRRRMGGLFYHFVIGNGTGSRDGQIEVGWRWRRQVIANRRGDINICLVGNFNYQHVSQAQFNSLIRLLKTLRKQYSIPISNIRIHKQVTKKVTECPGKNFPYKRILAALR